jgi:hypothetical protein
VDPHTAHPFHPFVKPSLRFYFLKSIIILLCNQNIRLCLCKLFIWRGCRRSRPPGGSWTFLPRSWSPPWRCGPPGAPHHSCHTLSQSTKSPCPTLLRV